jgi:hypothetical protein
MADADFNSVREQARRLSTADRLRLAKQLLAEARDEIPGDEIETGERGLAEWTDSTRGEDWSEFYPPSLRKRKVG